MLKVAMKTIGLMQENVYVVYNEKNEALVFDPGAQGKILIDWIETNHWQPLAILLTHCHFDHIGALDQLRDHFKVPVYVHSNEADFFDQPVNNLSYMLPEPLTQRKADHIWSQMGQQEVKGFTFTVKHTPGHSPGSVIYIFEEDEFVISGDLVFAGSIGRTDLPNADYKVLMESVRKEIMPLPGSFLLYPGHGSSTLVAEELATNPFLKS